MTEHACATDSTDSVPADDDRGQGWVLPVGSAVAVLASAVASVLSYGVLPDSVRIHWTLGMGPYYGPEFAPKPVVLAVFPLTVAAVAAVGWGLAVTLNSVEGFETVRPLYVATILGVLAVVVCSQTVVVWANL